MVNKKSREAEDQFFIPYDQRPFGEVTVNSHSKHVIEELSLERQPILPFELKILEGKHEAHKEEMEVLGRSMSDAMSQTSETWHDNGAADAINAASLALGHRANIVINGIRSGIEIPYPNPEDVQASMGSLVGVKFAGDETSYPHFITGMLREIPQSIQDLVPEDTEIVTAGSPFGRAVLGGKQGESRSFTLVNGREITISIASVRQISE